MRKAAMAAAVPVSLSNGILLLWQSQFPPYGFPVADFLTLVPLACLLTFSSSLQVCYPVLSIPAPSFHVHLVDTCYRLGRTRPSHTIQLCRFYYVMPEMPERLFHSLPTVPYSLLLFQLIPVSAKGGFCPLKKEPLWILLLPPKWHSFHPTSSPLSFSPFLLSYFCYAGIFSFLVHGLQCSASPL